MPRWSRGTRIEGLRCHSDAGQFTSLRYGERLAEIGAVPSIGTVADTYDNALAESVNGYYKCELIRGSAHWTVEKRPGRRAGDPVLGVHWHNAARLNGYLGDIPPAEFETAFYVAQRDDRIPVKSHSPSLDQTQGTSVDQGRTCPARWPRSPSSCRWPAVQQQWLSCADRLIRGRPAGTTRCPFAAARPP